MVERLLTSCGSKSKPVSSPVTVNGATQCLVRKKKHLYQGIVAKLNYLALDRMDLKHTISCLTSAVASPGLGDMQASTRVGRYLKRAPVAWQGFPFCDPRPGELLCFADSFRTTALLFFCVAPALLTQLWSLSESFRSFQPRATLGPSVPSFPRVQLHFRSFPDTVLRFKPTLEVSESLGSSGSTFGLEQLSIHVDEILLQGQDLLEELVLHVLRSPLHYPARARHARHDPVLLRLQVFDGPQQLLILFSLSSCSILKG